MQFMLQAIIVVIRLNPVVVAVYIYKLWNTLLVSCTSNSYYLDFSKQSKAQIMYKSIVTPKYREEM